MYRQQPVGNKLCHKKWLEVQAEKHQKRLKSVKADIDNKPPPTFSHLTSRKKREAQQEERYAQIEHENGLLLQKLSTILQKKPSRPQPQSGPARGESLHAPYRRRKLLEIMEENQRILTRIQTARPFIEQKEFTQFAQEHDALLARICEKDVVIDERVARQQQQQKDRREGRARKDKVAAASANDDLLEKPLLKEGRNIGDRYTIVTVMEISDPAGLSFRSYDLDSSKTEILDVKIEEAASLVDNNADLLLPANREALAGFLVQHLAFAPHLTLPRSVDPAEVSSYVAAVSQGKAHPRTPSSPAGGKQQQQQASASGTSAGESHAEGSSVQAANPSSE